MKQLHSERHIKMLNQTTVRIVYQATALVFLASPLSFGQSTNKRLVNHKKSPALLSCGNQVEYKEPVKAGVANIICLTTGFNNRSEECWQALAEYYYNVVPELEARIQRIYFVEVPKNTKPIRTLTELRNSSFKQKTFFECIYNVRTEKYSFVNYPFTKK